MPGVAIGPSHASPAAYGGGSSPEPEWTPADLGADLFDYWDAEDAATFTLSGSAVSAWASKINGSSAAQATGTAKPLLSATGLNNRPEVTFDAIDDELTVSGIGLFPSGSTACEMWALVRQAALPADTGLREVFTYGSATTGGSRRMQRNVVSGVNRANVSVDNAGVGANGNNLNVDFSGIHVVRAIINGATAQIDVDGVAGASFTAVTTSTGTTRIRIGANTAAAAAAFMNGGINWLGVTALLSEPNATLMLDYLKTRGGIA